MNRKQRRAMLSMKGVKPMRIVGPNEEPAVPTVEMKTTIPAGEVPMASIMIVGCKSGQVFIGHGEGQLHSAHALCMGAAQTLYAMLLQQMAKQADQRVMPVPTPLSNIILPPVGGRDS